MDAMRQSMRPKHQVLVLKCYPKFQKGVSEVKPNPSELSYLLYYASTRRSKIQKVAAFLEKKSETDVPKLRTGNVQVTLHIIRALIEKSPRDLPLYAPHLLRIFSMILKSRDLTMVEDSVAAFEALCENGDATTLPANPTLARQFEDVVRGYASLVQQTAMQSKGAMSAPVAIRWRMAGLKAIKSITASEAIGTDGGRQLNIVVPVILESLYSDGEDRLIALNKKAEGEREVALRRRTSIGTTRTGDSQPDYKEALNIDTAAESDRKAEEEAGLAAVQSLKQVFTANNRGQIRLATSALLNFLIEKTVPERPGTVTDRPGTALTSYSSRPSTWTTTLVEMVTKWTPVQDRFIILITTVEQLSKSPIATENMDKQLILATLVEWLLSSTINMIGLSVMDVLIGLIHHILALLQRGDQLSTALPHHEQTEAIDLFKPEDQPGNRSSVLDILNNRSFEEERPASLAHQQLLSRLRKCVASLATHIYYSDQVNDIVSALVLRLKPNPAEVSDVTAVEKPAEAAAATETPKKEIEFFSFGTARVTALNAIREVITTANRKSTVIGSGVVGRNRIGVRVWEGTQWLLRDSDPRVRRAYVEALLIWLRLEVTEQDFRIPKAPGTAKKRKTVEFGTEKLESALIRSHSNAHPASRSQNVRSTFLQLLHLAIYEEALEAPETDATILTLHLLLYNLVYRLGVNAVRTGLPMIRRLQEDINSSQLKSPKAKVNVGSLVHGYFWSCYSVFDFETTAPGVEISREVARRKKHHLWLTAVGVPPHNLDMIISSYRTRSEPLSRERAKNEALRPFDNVKGLIEQISLSYDSHMQSPPSSPPMSPGRILSMPKILTPGPNRAAETLPKEFEDAMNQDWTKESCIAAVESEKAHTSSPAGSRAGTTRSQPVNGNGAGDGDKAAAAAQIMGHRSSVRGSFTGTPINGSSDHGGTLRVDDLKRVLAGGALADIFYNRRGSTPTASPLRNASTAVQDFGTTEAPVQRERGPSLLSNATESLVDASGYEVSEDEGGAFTSGINRASIDSMGRVSPESYCEPPRATHMQEVRSPTSPTADKESSPRVSRGSRPRSSSEISAEDPEANARALRGQLVPDIVRGSIVSDEGVPPVPPLPQNLLGRTSRSSNRLRGEALAPGGVPFSGLSSGRSSANAQAPSRRTDALSPLPPLTTSPEEAGAAAAEAAGVDPQSQPSDHAAPIDLATPADSANVRPPSGRQAPGHLAMGDRPESLLAAASANAAGAAAALEAIAAAGGHPAVSSSPSIGESPSASAPGSRAGSVRRSGSGRGAFARGPGENKMLVQALLGSIEVADISAGRGIGRPPV